MGLIGQGVLLQPAFLAQLISAVVAGVTSFATAAAILQGGSSSELGSAGVSGASGATKSVSGTPCLPWGSACGRPKGGGLAGSSRDAPQSSGDVARQLGEHLSQVTWDKILRGKYIDFFLFTLPGN